MSQMTFLDKSFAKYMDYIYTLPILQEDEEKDLTCAVFYKGCLKSAQKLIISHLRLVVKIAMSFKGYGMSMMDLISEGNIGLIHSVKKFDPSKGVRLATYAIWWIKAYIKDYIIKYWSLVKIGTTTAEKKLFYNLREINNVAESQDATMIQNCADKMNVTKEELLSMKHRIGNADCFIDDSQEGGFFNKYNEDPSINQEDAMIAENDSAYKKSILKMGISSLSARERYVLYARRILDPAKKLNILAKEMNISCERVRQIENKVIQKLFDFANKKINGKLLKAK